MFPGGTWITDPISIERSGSGHTPGASARWTCANVLCIDTGLDSDEFAQLTVAEIRNGTAILHQFPQIEAYP